MNNRGTNYTGMKFNGLTLVRYLRPGGKGVGAIWEARCGCGNTREVTAKRVVHGQIRSCGKCEYSRKPTSNPARTLRAAERKLYQRYITRAGDRSIGWDLTSEQFLDIIGRECSYCGCNPDRKAGRSGLMYNGLDRVDGDSPYTQSNCVAACTTCRTLKGNLNAREFLDIVMRIATNIIHKMDSKSSSK